MKILLVSEFYPPVLGGLELHVQALGVELSRRGHQIHVATTSGGDLGGAKDVKVHTLDARGVRRLPHADHLRPFHPPVPDPWARRELRAIISDVRPHIVHAHNWLAASLPADMEAPLILTAHDASLVCPRRDLIRPDGSTCHRRGVVRCARCLGAARSWKEGLLLASTINAGRARLRPSAVIAVSSFVADTVGASMSAPVEVVPNFIPDGFPEGDERVHDLPAPPYVMFAGDPGRHKGLDVLLDLWRSDHRPPAHLVLALTRPPSIPVPPGVVVCQLSRSAMARALRGALAAIVPSRWPEPCATIVLEALSVGTPVVASRVGGNSDLISDGLDGFLVEPDDPDGIARHIRSLAEDESLRSQLGEAARRKGEVYLASAVVPRIEAIYRAAQAAEIRRVA